MLWQERIESLKAGLLGAIACGITAILLSLLVGTIWPELYPSNLQSSLSLGPLPWQTLGWAIATLTGFLFAVTYRYIIRQDPSSHLRSGAVLAFGLVRGLAQVETAWLLESEVVLILWMLGESLLLVAIARVVLDLAFNQGLLKTFQGFD